MHQAPPRRFPGPAPRAIALAAAAPVLLAALLFAAPPARADKSVPYAAILDGPGKSVVAVRYQLRPKERPKGGEGPKTRKITAGIVAGPAGQVVINASAFPDPDDGPDVIEPFDFKIVTEDGREVEAEVAGLARDVNLAFLRAKDPAALKVPPVSFDGAPAVAIGDEVFVVGLLSEPYAFGHVAYRAHLNGRAAAKQLFSLDATLPDLCAGGLVTRTDGRPVGILGVDMLPESWDGNEAGNLLSLFGSANLGRRPGYLMLFPAGLFAAQVASPPPLPSEKEDDKKGWLGITMQPLSRDLAEYWNIDAPGGVILGAVLPGSPAAEAGLQPGDVIISVDGEPLPVRENRDLTIVQKRIRRAGAGRAVPLAVWRGGEVRDVSVKLSASPTTILTAEEYENDSFGLTVRELTYDLIQAMNLSADTRGVVVSKTERAGWAEVAGIGRGDIVQKVDGSEISDLASFKAALEKARADRTSESLFLVMRAYKTRFVRVQTDWK